MVKVWTAQYRYPGIDRVDITMKCPPKTIGVAFQPGWDIVTGIKSGYITAEQYTKIYKERMDVSFRTNRSYWDALVSKPEIVLVCFCPNGDFCHRYLLTAILQSNYPDIVKLCGEINYTNGKWV